MIITALAGCSDETSEIPDTEPQPEITEVPLTISLGEAWNIDATDDATSRATPPGIGGTTGDETLINGEEETQNVNKVRVVTFRRKDPDNFTIKTDNTLKIAEPFIYDATNDMVLDVETEYSANTADKFTKPHKHRIAKGTLRKVYGYEYKVVAIAYDSNLRSTFSSIYKSDSSIFSMPDGEDNWFELNLHDGLTIDEFKAQILEYEIINDNDSWRDFISGNTPGIIHPQNADELSYKAAQIPQLFFGECHTAGSESSDGVIKYAVTDAKGEQLKDLAVTGILYRGLAKVELRITPTKRHIITDHAVEWICLMADNVFTTVKLTGYDDFLKPDGAIKSTKGKSHTYTPIAYCKVEDESQKTITAYLLPCKTHLAVRIKTDNNEMRNAQLTYENTESTGTGTGIISPDVHDNEFYLRRNHKYILTVSDSEKLFK